MMAGRKRATAMGVRRVSAFRRYRLAVRRIPARARRVRARIGRSAGAGQLNWARHLATLIPSGGEFRLPAEALHLLAEGLAFLKGRRLRGKNPEIFADIATDNADLGLSALLLLLSGRGVDQIAKDVGDPSLANVVYRPWFTRLFDRVSFNLARRVEGNALPGAQEKVSV